MYLRKLRIKNLKLLRDVEIDFTDADGKPRPFTVLIGENGLCKTSLLQAIALAASGADRANQLADAISYRDLRRPEEPVEVEAEFSFSEKYHEGRVYPGYEDVSLDGPPRLHTALWLEPGFDLFAGESKLENKAGDLPAPQVTLKMARGKVKSVRTSGSMNPLGDARGRNLPHWFVAGYGVVRTLPAPVSVTPEEIASPSRDRLNSLFKPGRRLIATGFADILPPDVTEAFHEHLRKAFVDHEILPAARGISLRARGNIPRATDLPKAHALTLALPQGQLDVPTIWLSQGYQAMMAWVADLVGQVWWEAGKQEVPLDEMEGICLVDELDLHLHPRWQKDLVERLKAAFPRIQFIATTHSPMILPGLKQDEVLRLRRDEEGNVVVRKAKQTPALLTGTELYSRFFGIRRLEPRKLDRKLFEYATLAGYRGRSDDEDAKAWGLLTELRAAGVDPGFEPEPRKAARKKARANGKPAARKR